MTESDIVIRLKGIGKHYRIYDRPEDRLKQMLVRGKRKYFREFDALREVSLTIHKGETVGLVGRNGSGKSTLLQMVCGTLIPTSGTMEVHGRISALLELGAGFNPEFSGRENIYLNAAIMGLSRKQTDERYESIVAFSGLQAHQLNQAVKTYSSGMYVRLAFSVAVALEPDILVVDEALAVGDEGFQRKCFARLHELKQRGTTILFVSHAAQTVVELCDRAVLIDQGEMLCDGEPKSIIAAYHRLLFAPDDRREVIRADLKQGRFSVESAAISQPALDPSMVSESRIEYEKDGGEIINIMMTDMQGNPANILHTRTRYQLHYTMKYSRDCEQPQFGMLIKTKRGIDLGGAVATEYVTHKRNVSVGEIVQVCFEFECTFRPGSYFVNCGTTRRENDEDVFVHRIVDAFQFKVVDDRKNSSVESAGAIDMDVKATLIASANH